jgi:hypothetical protein
MRPIVCAVRIAQLRATLPLLESDTTFNAVDLGRHFDAAHAAKGRKESH